MALNINGTTGISGVDGSASAPAVTGTDSNTGITFPAADTIKFSTGGVERMSITNSGITGITAGITMAEQWELSDEVNVSSAQTYVLTGTWAKRNQNGAGTIGASGMSVSSGVFTFPSTGVYRIDFIANVRQSQGIGRRRVAGIINTTHDNSTYIDAYYGGTNLSNRGSTTSGTDTCQLIFDVQNTSNYKIKFSINFSNDGKINARDSGNPTKTNVIFTKLGDT